MESKTVAEVLVQALVDAGVTHVFGGHGGAVIPLIEAVIEHPKLEWILTRNEGGASLAAAAHSKLKAGRGIGAVIATSGPGATNLTTGLVSAVKDNLPLVALTGLKPSYKSGLTDFQDLEAARLFAGVLLFSHRVMHPVQAPQLMRDALAYAVSQRTAVHLSIPEDIQGYVLAPEQQLPIKAMGDQILLRKSLSSEEALLETATYLTQRRRSRIIIGVGHLAVHVGSQVLALAERLNAPIVTRLDAKGAVDESHPLCLGVVGVHGNPGLEVSRDMIESADCIVSVGIEDQMLAQLVLTDGIQSKDLVLIQPDTANFTGRFFLAAAAVGDLGHSLDRLLAEIPEDGGGRAGPLGEREEQFPITLAWERLKAGHWRQQKQETARFVARTEDPSSDRFCHPSHVYAALNRRLGPEDTLCVDVGDQTLWAAMLGHLTRGTRTLSDEFMGTMGYALPAAIAASLTQRRGTHVVVAGDGAVQMTVGELATAVQHGCRVVVVVFCNESLGRVKFGFGGKSIPGTELRNPDFVQLARAYGAGGAHVGSGPEADGAIERAWAAEGVFVVQVAVDPALRAEMAKMHDVHAISALARRLSDVLPESMAGLRRPQAMVKLAEHFQRVHGGGEFSEDELAAIRAVITRWREEFEREPSAERTDSGLASYMMQKIHMLGTGRYSSECYPGCGCWDPAPRASGGPAAGGGRTVELHKGGGLLDGPQDEGFPGPRPAELLRSAVGIDVGDPREFGRRWRAAAEHLFQAKAGGAGELEELLRTGRSNGRQMSWCVMDIAPHQDLPLHAHPNIEVIYVARGTLQELRFSGPPVTRRFEQDDQGHPLGPNLEHCRATFQRKAHEQGSFLVNEVGSIHQSFTSDDEAVLLVLWGGCHANILRTKLPKQAYEEGFRPVELTGASVGSK
uniref:Acetolactate synthase n=1 Tax=Tetraselmis sp. GSL018 TaxID=582737 RepID=A0A061SDN4_9CHLO